MPYAGIKKNAAFTFDMVVVNSASRPALKSNPTIAAGDWKISKDGGALANLATLPVVAPASSVIIKVALSATEMNADRITVVGIDAAGAEWDDNAETISTIVIETLANVDKWASVEVGVTTTTLLPKVDTSSISDDTAAASNLEKDYDGTGLARANSTIGTVTTVTNQVTADVTAISGDSTAADNLETMLDGTGGNKLSLSQLNIVASGNDSAIVATGLGTGHGIIATGGSGGGHGISSNGDGGGHGILSTATGTGNGFHGSGGTTDGTSGMLLTSGATNGNGLKTLATGTGDDIQGDITGNLSGSVGSVAAGGITAASFAAGAIDAAAIANGAIDAATFAAGAIDAAAIATDAITSAKIAANAIGSSELATDAIGAAQIATDAIGSAELATTAVNEIRDAIYGGAVTQAIVDATSADSFLKFLQEVWSATAGRRKINHNGTDREQLFYKQDGTTISATLPLRNSAGSKVTDALPGSPAMTERDGS